MKSLTCRHPNLGLGAFQRQMDRFFEDLVPGRPGAVSARSAWGPALDISETPEEIRIEAEVPGIDPADIEISVEGKTLTIRGEKKSGETDEGRTYRHVERRHGTFSRLLTLSTPVQNEAIEAVATDGVLTITLPKRQEARPRRIEIQAK